MSGESFTVSESAVLSEYQSLLAQAQHQNILLKVRIQDLERELENRRAEETRQQKPRESSKDLPNQRGSTT